MIDNAQSKEFRARMPSLAGYEESCCLPAVRHGRGRAARTAFGLASHLAVAVLHGGTAGELYSPLIIDADALDQDLIADLDDVLNLLDSEVSQLANMTESVLAWEHLDESPEIFN